MTSNQVDKIGHILEGLGSKAEENRHTAVKYLKKLNVNDCTSRECNWPGDNGSLIILLEIIIKM